MSKTWSRLPSAPRESRRAARPPVERNRRTSGYTLLLCAIDTITAPIVSRRAPFDGVNDFAPVTQLAQSPNVWLASLSFSAQSMKELVEIAKAKPRQIDYASSGAPDTRDRYNAANTMKMAQNIFINAGTILYGEYATALMKVVASTCPNHDTIGGCCSVEMNSLRYGRRTHSCRANFIHELTRFGMGEADIVANVNFFMSVPVGRDGHMAISESPSTAGDFVDVEALTDVIAVISNCPQKYNPACGYNPSAVRVETYARQRAHRGR